MNTQYTLKNFRVFDSEGSTFELAPVTILTGPNGSGKSSVSKSLQMFKNVKIDSDKSIDLSQGTHLLGRFDKITNWNSKEDEVTIEFSYNSFWLPLCPNLLVRLTLSGDKEKPYMANIVDKEILTSEGIPLIKNGNIVNHQLVIENMIKRAKEWQFLRECYNSRQVTQIEDGIFDIKIGESERFLNLLHEIINNMRKIKHRSSLFMTLPLTTAQYDFSVKTSLNQSDSNMLTYGDFPFLFSLMESHNDSSTLAETGIINDLDIIHIFDSIGKKKLPEWISQNWENLLSTNGNNLMDFRPAFKNDIEEMIDDFVKSPYPQFSQYFQQLEIAFLDKKYDNESEYAKICWFPSRYIFTYDEFIKAQEEIGDYEKYGKYTTISKPAQYDKVNKIKSKLLDIEPNPYDGYDYIWPDEHIKNLYENISYAQIQEAGVKFILLYKLLYILSDKQSNIAKNSYFNQHFLYEYFTIINEEAFSCTDLLTNTEYISGIRSNSKRLYSFEDNGELGKVIYKYLRLNIEGRSFYSTDEFDNKTSETPIVKSLEYVKGTFLKEGLKLLLNIENVEFETDKEGVGTYIYLTKDINGEKHRILLSDMGYGNTPLLSMLLQIEIAIESSISRNRNMRLSIGLDEEYNHHIEDYLTRTTICIEEPESNLHPAIQSRLADVFKMAAEKYPVKFILETHSEYLVRRSQVLVAEEKYKDEQELAEKCPFKVYYLPEAGTGKPYDMEYMPNGRFKQQFGKGFFDEASNLALNIF